jgi:TatD DNase family protein
MLERCHLRENRSALHKRHMWIDAHCHLDAENTNDPQALITRARDAGVETLVAVGVGRKGGALRDVKAIAERDPHIFFTAGIHPHDANNVSEEEMAEIEQALAHEKCVALGEVGLDYHYNHSPRDEQRALFERMIRLGAKTKKPLMLHVREAHDEALELLEKNLTPDNPPGVVHCFTEGKAIAERYLALGFYLSIPGIVTFKTAAPLQDAVVHMPKNRVIVETDSPYLAPIPMRGKKNEPSFVTYVGAKVAELMAIPTEACARLTTENARRLFRI